MEPVGRDIRPVVLDLSLDDDELRAACSDALRNTLSPMVGLVNHGCEKACCALAEAMKRRIASEGGLGDVKQQACDIDGDLVTSAAELRGCLRSVCLRALRLALDDTALDASLAERSLDLQGRLCLRAYPPSEHGGTERLGPHCDSTLCTLLWSDGPGLEVLDPERASEWEPNAVLQYGLPTMGPPGPELSEDQWARVQLPWQSNPLLLTLGTSWLSSDLTASRLPARCAVLHRVTLPQERTRHSLPFLADLVPIAYGDEREVVGHSR